MIQQSQPPERPFLVQVRCEAEGDILEELLLPFPRLEREFQLQSI